MLHKDFIPQSADGNLVGLSNSYSNVDCALKPAPGSHIALLDVSEYLVDAVVY